jgi:gliding motility-associated-like protein
MKKKYFHIACLLFTVISVGISQEICNNAIDDDGDGLIDMQDIQDCNCGLVDDDVIGDFEVMSCCPQLATSNLNTVGIECLADGWILATEFVGGADYINLCGYTVGGLVPLPIPSGSGAIGLNQTASISDIIGYCMDNALVVGQSYDLSFYVGFNDTLYPPPSNNYVASPLDFEFVLWGNNSCDNLPGSGIGCLEDSGDDWYILTTIPFTGVADSTWLYVSTSFISSDPSIAIAIGGSCDFFETNGYNGTYHFLDDFHLTGQFQTPPTQEITITGDCVSGVYVEVPSVGIGYQWYLEGITILGATNNIYQVPFDQQGSYTVLIDYGSSCETVVPVDVSFDLEVLDVSGNAENISCFGAIDGIITSTVNPDVNVPLDYVWSTSESTSNIDNLANGSYDLTVTDSNGCFGSTSFTIIEPPEMMVTLIITQSNGIDPAQGEVIVLGGSPDYDILWCNFDTNNQTTLEPGLCSVTIIDASGCEQTFNFEIFEPLEVEANTDFGICADSCDSEIMLNITGGDSPYNVLWNNSGAGFVQSGLCDGLYAYIVTDNFGTEVIGTVDLVSEESSLSISAMYDSLICIGSDLNTISLSTSGGEAPYTYLWSTQDSTAMIDSLTAGIYTVLVTDSLGCTAVDTIELLSYDSLTLTNNITPASCGAANGSIDISILDTVDIQSFTWSTTATTEDISGLLAGNYSVTMVDEFGCTHNYNFVVNSDSDLMVSSVVNHENCAGSNDGDITLTITGGTSPYTITWGDGTDDNPKENLSVGTYGVTLTDTNGCIWTDSIVIQTLSQLEISDSVQGNSCSGVNDGSINISIEIGTASNYAWSTSEITEDISGLSEGMYELTITDEYDCEYTYTFEVEIEPPYEVVATIENNNCVGDSTGSIALDIMPVGSYNYLWSTGDATKDIIGLPEGTYFVTITDASGCEQIHDYDVNIAPSYTVTATIEDAKCVGDSTGSIALTIIPMDTYDYLWSTGATTKDVTDLGEGNYIVTITDENGCEQILDYYINIAPSYTVTATIEDTKCVGDSTGSIVLMITPMDTYNYLWSTGATTKDVINLGEGNYTVTITDTNGCEQIQNYNINSPVGLTLTAELVHIGCDGGATGSISVDPLGGTGSFQYLWSTGEMTSSIENLNEGNYGLTIQDDNGCTLDTSFTILAIDPLVVSDSIQNVQCFGEEDGQITLTIESGNAPFDVLWSTGENTLGIIDLAAGNYSVTVTDTEGCEYIQNFIIISSDQLVIQVENLTPPSVLGNDGQIDITIIGGSPDYTYLWNQGDTTQDLTGLTWGEYTVVVTDSNGCTASQTWTFDPLDLIATHSSLDNKCFGDCEGEITLFISGGTLPYSISWEDGSTTDDRTSLCDGFYHVTINDATGQFVEISDIEISSPDQILLSGNVYPVSCLNSNDGSISVTTTGGTEPYNYQWDQSGVDNDSLSSLSPGEYIIQVTDENLCTESAIYSIEDINLINIEITQLPYDCEEGFQEITITGQNEYDYDIYINGELSTLSTEMLESLDPGSYAISYAINPACVLPITILEIAGTQNYNLLLNPLTIEIKKGEEVTISLTETVGLGLVKFELNWESQNAFTCIDDDCQSIILTCETAENLELTIIDPWGCEQYFTIPITLITEIEDFTIGNIFSPNGDNVNDEVLLVPNIEGLTLLTFNFYDRWGNEVFRYVSGSDPYWNGMLGNQYLSTGVYVYRATYEYNGEVIIKFGDITLLR